MHTEQSESTERLSPESIEDFNKLFKQASPRLLREGLIKMYLCYVNTYDPELTQDVEKVDKPIRELIRTLGKIAGVEHP